MALACVFCNRHKGSDIASVVPGTDRIVRFFNPRTDRWNEHFQLNGVIFEHLTEIGEATIRILKINHNDQILEREVLNQRNRYPNRAALLLIEEH